MSNTKKLFTAALAMYVFINVLFVLKYGLRVLSPVMAVACTAFYAAVIVCLVCLSARLWKQFGGRVRQHFKPWHVYTGVLIVLIVLIVLQMRIDPYSLQVDRWSAIHNFLDNMLRGDYPYAAQTHLGGYGSPFPVWQMVHLPFYLLGNVGLSFAVCALMYFDGCRRLFGLWRAVAAFMLLVASPAFLYEVCVRSDLLTNFLFVAALVMFLFRRRVDFQRHYLLLAVVTALVASTRLSAAIPLAIFLFPAFIRSGLRRQVVFVLLVAAVFVLTFLPFVFWDSDMLFFFEYNPFVLQTRQGHVTDLVVLAVFGMWMALQWKGRFVRFSFAVSVCLMALVVVTFAHNMWQDNSWNQLFESLYDISYFNMALPFVILCLRRV